MGQRVDGASIDAWNIVELFAHTMEVTADGVTIEVTFLSKRHDPPIAVARIHMPQCNMRHFSEAVRPNRQLN